MTRLPGGTAKSKSYPVIVIVALVTGAVVFGVVAIVHFMNRDSGDASPPEPVTPPEVDVARPDHTAAGSVAPEALMDCFAAAEKGDVAAVRVGLDVHPEWVNMRQHGGGNLSLLEVAIRRQAKPLVRLLLERGADVNAINPTTGDNAVIRASSTSRLDLLEIVLAHGGDVSVTNAEGKGPLYHAATSRDPAVVTRLIDAGADVNAATRRGVTPLHQAAKGQKAEIVKILLAHGAEVRARDVNQRTPLNWATENVSGGNEEVVALLKDHSEAASDTDAAAAGAAAVDAEDDGARIDKLIAELADPVFPLREGQEAAEELVKIGAPAVEPLIKVVEGRHLGTKVQRAWAARALGDIGDDRAVAALADAVATLGRGDLGRREAAKALAKFGAKAVDPLIKMVKDKQFDLQGWAVITLSDIGGRRALKALTPILSDPSWRRRTWAIEGLKRLGGPEATQAIVGVLADRWPDVRKHAVASLESMKWKPATDAERVSLLVAKEEWDDLVEMGGPAVDALIEALKFSYADTARGAARTLARIGKPSVEPLMAMVRDKEQDAGQLAIEALGEIGDPRAVDPLVKVLKETIGDGAARERAATALAKLGQPGRGVLRRLAKSKDGEVRELATKAMAEVGGEDAIAVQIAALGDKDYGIQQSTIKSLVKMGSAAVTPLIAALKTHSERRVRANAVLALREIGDKRAVEPLIEALRDKAERVRYCAAAALGTFGDRRAVEPLIAVLGGGGSELFYPASRSLGELGDPRAVEPLIAALSHREQDVRARAAAALGDLKDARAVEPLVQAMSATEPDVRRSAARALESIGPPAVERLIAVLKDTRSPIQGMAAFVLGRVRDKRAIPSLVEALKQPGGNPWDFNPTRGSRNMPSPGASVRRPAAYALARLDWAPGDDSQKVFYFVASRRHSAAARLGAVSLPALVMALNDPDASERQLSAWALSLVENSEAIPLLLRALDDNSEGVAKAARQSLVKIGPPAVEPVITTLEHRRWQVRSRACAVLTDLKDKRAVQPLVARLDDEDWSVRAAAAEALDAFAWQPANDRQQVRYLIAKSEWQSAAKKKEVVVDALKPLLIDRRDVICRLAAQTLDQAGWTPQSDVDKVRYLIATKKWDEATAVGAAAVETLIIILERNPESRCSAAWALGDLKDQRAVDPLIRVLLAEDGEYGFDRRTAGAIATALGQLGDRRAVEPLIRLLASDPYMNPRPIVKALGQLGDERAVRPLLAVIRRLARDNDFWWATGEAMEITVDALKQIGRPSVPVFIELANDSESLMREKAIEALAEFGDRRAVEPLIALLTSPKEKDRSVRVAVAQALGRLKDPRAAEPCLGLLEKESGTMLKAALIVVLGELGDQRAVPPLVEMLMQEKLPMRIGVAMSLEKLGWQPTNDVQKAIFLVARQRWAEAADRGEVAATPLVEAMHYKETRRPAFTALLTIGQPATPALIEALKDKDKKLRGAAVFLLGKVGDQRAVLPVIDMLKDPERVVRREAASTLGALADKRAIEPLKALLDDEKSSVRRAATAAIEKLKNTP